METGRDNRKGSNLLSSPTFVDLGNGRFRCVETGHEVLAGDKESYSQSKRCRLGLIDHALSQNKPPLNMFTQHPLHRTKLVCKLTGVTVNKSDEHIWKHVNGKRFLNKLEQTDKIKKRGKEAVEIISEIRDASDSDSEEPDFWMPPGRDRLGSGSESSHDSVEGDRRAHGDDADREEIGERTKRMSIEIGPSSFASSKKRSKKDMS